jgi:predicted transcriptional regulator of viral defense system
VGPFFRPIAGKRSTHSSDGAIAALAAGQHGVVSVAQLLDAGLSRDAIDIRARSGRLHRLYRGVYAVGHTALTQRSRELAAVLSCGRHAVLSHRSAGARLGLVRSPAWIEVTAPRACKPRAGVVVHRSRRLHPEEREVVEGIPVTSIARTLVDLAEVLDERRLAQAVQEAEVRGASTCTRSSARSHACLAGAAGIG